MNDGFIPSPGWLLDEVASAGRENLDRDHVSRYDSKEDADAAAEVALLQELGLNRTSEVVDLGAGTGQFVLAVAPVCARIVAVDISPVMLEALRTKVHGSNLSNVETVESGFLTYEHPRRSADFVYSRFALHHLPDFWKAAALERIRGILRPGGVLRLWDVVYHFEPDEAEERLEAWCGSVAENGQDGKDGAGGEDVGDIRTLGGARADEDGRGVEDAWRRSEIEEHIRDEHSTFTWLLEPMMERCGFDIEEAVYSDDGFFARYVARVRATG